MCVGFLRAQPPSYPLLTTSSAREQNEIETWAQALKAYDEDDYAKALDLFGVRVPNHRVFQSSENGLDPWSLIEIPLVHTAHSRVR